MPELPDISLYVDALNQRLQGQPLSELTLQNPFVLRTVQPAATDFTGRKLLQVGRMGKRICFEFEGEHWAVIHLMIAGRLHWYPAESKKRPRKGILSLRFANGAVLLTEAGSKRRAALHLFDSADALQQMDRGGLEIEGLRLADFRDRLTLRNHTLKRALTDPGLFSGIGNAYSDEILHQARLSPVKLTQKLTGDEIKRLHKATLKVLNDWTKKLRQENGDQFPEKVTAFRDGMAVHGRYREPCPDCGTPVQRIRYVSNETNYCPRCQTDGKVLADRSLSRLLKQDWPRTVEELEDKS
jgi:formamidopyrimidine-DNA glycosylase